MYKLEQRREEREAKHKLIFLWKTSRLSLLSSVVNVLTWTRLNCSFHFCFGMNLIMMMIQNKTDSINESRSKQESVISRKKRGQKTFCLFFRVSRDLS